MNRRHEPAVPLALALALVFLALALAFLTLAACAGALREDSREGGEEAPPSPKVEAGAQATASSSNEPAEIVVVLSKTDNEAALVDPSTFAVIAKLPTGNGPHEAAISHDGRRAYVSDYGQQEPGSTITVLDLPGRTVAATWDLGEHRRPHGIAISEDGSRLWVTSEVSQAVVELDADTGEIARVWSTGQAGSHMLDPAPGGRKVYVANVGSGSVTAIHRDGRTRTIGSGPETEGLDVSPDGREVWVGSNGAHTISVIDAAADSVVVTFPSGGRVPIRVKLTPDGRQAWVSNAESGTVTVFDVASRRLLDTVEVGAAPVGILMSPDGRYALVANTEDDRITVIDVATRAVLRSFSTGREPDGMAWWRP